MIQRMSLNTTEFFLKNVNNNAKYTSGSYSNQSNVTMVLSVWKQWHLWLQYAM